MNIFIYFTGNNKIVYCHFSAVGYNLIKQSGGAEGSKVLGTQYCGSDPLWSWSLAETINSISKGATSL